MLMPGNDVPRRRFGRRRRRRHRGAARAYSKKPPPGSGATAPLPPTRRTHAKRAAAAKAARQSFGRPTAANSGGVGTRGELFLINICTGLVSRYLFRFISHASAGTRAYIIVGGGVLIGRPPELFTRSLTPPLHANRYTDIIILLSRFPANRGDRFSE